MVIFATALMIAARPDLVNPGCYVNAWDSARIVFDIISWIFFIWKLLDEVQEMIRYIYTALQGTTHTQTLIQYINIYTYICIYISFMYCVLYILCICMHDGILKRNLYIYYTIITLYFSTVISGHTFMTLSIGCSCFLVWFPYSW